MNNNYKRYCSKCHFTVYPTEGVRNSKNKVEHSNCKEMMSDRSVQRHLNPRISNMLGSISKKKLVRLWEEYPNV
jgi:glutathionylspermidine synthase